MGMNHLKTVNEGFTARISGVHCPFFALDAVDTVFPSSVLIMFLLSQQWFVPVQFFN
jgi:hypothetical protein